MALTNYLGQSLLAVGVFTGVGLGLVGRVGPATVVLIAVVLFAVQLWFSRWWLDRHRVRPGRVGAACGDQCRTAG